MTDRDRSRPSRCSERTTAGNPCRARPRPGRSVCFAHDPDLADQRAEARRRGGANSATVARQWRGMPEPVRDLLVGLIETFDEVRAGDVEPARASAVASVARAALSAWDAAVVEDRLDEIEQALATRRIRVEVGP